MNRFIRLLFKKNYYRVYKDLPNGKAEFIEEFRTMQPIKELFRKHNVHLTKWSKHWRYYISLTTGEEYTVSCHKH